MSHASGYRQEAISSHHAASCRGPRRRSGSGRAVSHRGITPDNFVRSVELYEHALALDPQSVEANTLLAATLAGRVLAGMTSSRAADVARAKRLIEQVSAISPRSTLAHFVKGDTAKMPFPNLRW